MLWAGDAAPLESGQGRLTFPCLWLEDIDTGGVWFPQGGG